MTIIHFKIELNMNLVASNISNTKYKKKKKANFSIFPKN